MNGLGKMVEGGSWIGGIPPQWVLANRRFERVAVEPPDFNPGSWVGAGNGLVDVSQKVFWMTTRWKRSSEKGFSWDSGVDILKSTDGERFDRVTSLHRRDLAGLLGDGVRGVEGQQLVLDPLSGKYHLYLAIHWEGEGWSTALLRAESPMGPWQTCGTVIPLGDDFDTMDARDAVIGIVDGRYIALYKAACGNRPDGWTGASDPEKESRVQVALATSSDGFQWAKHGPLTIDGKPQPEMLLLSGSFFSGVNGPLFMGMESRSVINGITCGDLFTAYNLDLRNKNLETVFRGRWTPLSPYERDDYAIHSYMDIVFDPFKERLLIYAEAIDPNHTKEIGIDTETDRLLLYTVDL